MTVLTAGATHRAARLALRARLALIAPDGLLWLDSAALAHPESTRVARLPFPFVIGRIAEGNVHHTVREVELVASSLDPDQDIARALTGYARFVVMTVPTIHARLTGRTLLAWQDSQVAA